MSAEDDDIQDMTDNTVMDDAGDPQGSEKPASAEPSTAKDVSNQVPDDDPYAIIKDAVEKRKPKPAASSATVEEDPAPKRERQPAYKEPDNEAFTDVPFNKHPRFQQLLDQRNSYKVNAERYNNVQDFLDNNGLSAEEAADLLIIGGLMKVNPIEAWKRMKPGIQRLLVAAGEIMPDDLKALVQQQKMTPEAAIEVSRARAASTSVDIQRSFDQQQADRRIANEQAGLRHSAAASWEADRRRRDPNFDAKLPAIRNQVKILLYDEGIPDTPQGVQDQLRRAYEEVNKTMPQLRSPVRRPAITPVNGSGQGAADARPAPKNTMEIIQAELAKREAR